MADNVYIDGFSQDAMSQLPKWATEDTMSAILKSIQTSTKMQDQHFQKLEASLRKFTGVAGKSAGSAMPDPKLMGQVNDELRDSLKFGADEAKQNAKTKKHWADENKQKTIGGALFGEMSKRATAFNAVLAGIDFIAAAGIRAMKDNVEGYASMYRAGIGVVDSSTGISDGFMSLQHMILLSGIRLKDLMAVTTKYSNTVSVYGTQKFVKASVYTQKALQGLGYSAVDGLEFTAMYLDSIKGFTNTAGMSSEMIALSTAKFGATMRNLSLQTGQSTQELMTKFKDLAKTTDASILSTRYGAKATESMTGFLAGLKDQNLAKSLQDLMSAPIKQVDETVNALLASGQGMLGQGLSDITSKITAAAANGASLEAQTEMFRQFAASVQVSDAEKQNLQLQALGGNTQARKSLDIIASLEHSARDIAALTPEKMAEIEKETRAMNARNKIADQMNAISARFNAMFTLNTETLEWFGNELTHVADGMDWISKKFEGSIIPSIAAVGAAIMGGLLAFKSVTSTGSWLINKIRGITVPEMIGPQQQGMMSKIVEFLKNGISKSMTWLGEAFSSIAPKIMGFISGPIKVLSELFARFAGPVGAVIGAFQVGYLLGEQLYKLVEDFDWFQAGMDKLFSWLDHVLQYMPGQIGRDAKTRLDASAKVDQKNIETTLISQGAMTPLASKQMPKSVAEPARTTVQSVSAAPAVKLESDTATPLAKSVDVESVSKSAPVAKEPEINSILKYQTLILEQLLDKNSDILTAHRDMVKLTRNS